MPNTTFEILPNNIECEIESTEGVVKGQTASSSYKPAKLKNGLDIMVPPFVESGNKIVYWTARGTISGEDWRDVTVKQFEEWGVKYHELKFGKPYYDLFIDDKNMNAKDWK